MGNASEHLPFWLSALLTISIAYYLARLFWLLMPVGGGIEWTVSMAPASTSEPSTVAVNYDSIADAHLFGENSANANPVPVETAPSTTRPGHIAPRRDSRDPALAKKIHRCRSRRVQNQACDEASRTDAAHQSTEPRRTDGN